MITLAQIAPLVSATAFVFSAVLVWCNFGMCDETDLLPSPTPSFRSGRVRTSWKPSSGLFTR